MMFLHLRFVIEGIEMRRASRHVQINHAFRLGRVVQSRIWFRFPRARQQITILCNGSGGQGPQAHRSSAQKVSAGCVIHHLLSRYCFVEVENNTSQSSPRGMLHLIESFGHGRLASRNNLHGCFVIL